MQRCRCRRGTCHTEKKKKKNTIKYEKKDTKAYHGFVLIRFFFHYTRILGKLLFGLCTIYFSPHSLFRPALIGRLGRTGWLFRLVLHADAQRVQPQRLQ